MTEIDYINRKILRELEVNGRISNSDLADKVGLSPSACLRRVQELERKGIIQGYRAIINRQAMGTGVTAYITVSLAGHSTQAIEAFQKAIARADEVRECHQVTGTIEYILRIEVADLEAYKNFHANVLGKAPNINNIVTHIVMDSPKDLRA